ncbi:MAG: endonuclease/exonuclease/phosphatase family protein [Deltaproteobacteria bacterium]|nr:endonuclease/exonuclease/phosphatase family protein [Deltaproteobacteria bacterium]
MIDRRNKPRPTSSPSWVRNQLSAFVASTTSSFARSTPHRSHHPLTAARADHLVVATANIQFQADEQRLLDLVDALQQYESTTPAIVALQEVEGTDHLDGHTIYQIATHFGMSMRYQAARRHPMTDADAHGSFGNAVLSSAGFVDDDAAGLGRGRVELCSEGGWEPRVAVDVAVPLDDGSALRVLSTHLDHGGVRGFLGDNVPGEAQLERLLDAADGIAPTLIVGDFNLVPDRVADILSGSRFIDAARSHACHSTGTAGRRRIDYVLVDADAFEVKDCEVVRLYDLGGGRHDISDHHAVVATLRRRTR